MQLEPVPTNSQEQESVKAAQELVLILDFGAQYTQLIARRVRECHVYCEILPFDTPGGRTRGP